MQTITGCRMIIIAIFAVIMINIGTSVSSLPALDPDDFYNNNYQIEFTEKQYDRDGNDGKLDPMINSGAGMLLKMWNKNGLDDNTFERLDDSNWLQLMKRAYGKCGPFKICGPLRLKHY